MTLFFEVAIALVLAAACGTLFYFFRQPTVVGFIFAGIIIGLFGYSQSGHNLELIEGASSIGVALLLFIVGLEMQVKEIRRVGLNVVLAGSIQVILTFAAAYGICTLLGLASLPSLYLSIAMAFSSTVIVVKILSEKKDLNSLYGRLALGILLIQDLITVLLLIFLSGLVQSEGALALNLVLAFLKGGFSIALAIYASRFIPRFLDFIGKSPELLYLFSLAWAVGIAALFDSPWVGLSAEVGGLLAGLTLANSSEHFQISARLKPLRDFFLIILFIGLGARMLSGGGPELIGPAVLLSLIVLVFKPFIVTLILAVIGYKPRTSFLAGLLPAQISEFSFILMFLGAKLGHVGSGEVSLIAIVGIATIFISSYLIMYGRELYAFLRPFIDRLKFTKKMIEEAGEETMLENHIVLIGVHRMGESILKALSNSPEAFVALDFDPEVVAKLRTARLPVIYGDAADPEIQEMIGLGKAKILISTIPDAEDNAAILHYMKKYGSAAKVVMAAKTPHEAEYLYQIGADYVIIPQLVSGAEIARMIANDPDLSGLDNLRQRDMKSLLHA